MVEQAESLEICTAMAVIHNDDGEVFTAVSPKWQNLRVVPGGKLERDETALQAGVRETFEETGFKTQPICELFAGTLDRPPEYSIPAVIHYTAVLLRHCDGQMALDPTELSSGLWVPVSDLMNLGDWAIPELAERTQSILWHRILVETL